MLIAKDEPVQDKDADVYAKSSVGRSSFRSKSIQKQINQANGEIVMDDGEEKDLSKENKINLATTADEDDSQYQEY